MTRRKDLCLTSQNTHKRQTFVPPVGFKPATTVSERPQTDALDRSAKRIGTYMNDSVLNADE
jgi:hypothetical protein